MRNRAEVSKESNEEMNASIKRLVKAIAKKSPSFFKEFKIAMESKNPLQIEEMLGQAGVQIYENIEIAFPDLNIGQLEKQIQEDINNESILTDGEVDVEKIAGKHSVYSDLLSDNYLSNGGDSKRDKLCFAVVWAVYAAIAVHNAVAVTTAVALAFVAAVYAAIAVVVKVKFFSGEKKLGNNPDNLLVREMLIQEIIQVSANG